MPLQVASSAANKIIKIKVRFLIPFKNYKSKFCGDGGDVAVPAFTGVSRECEHFAPILYYSPNKDIVVLASFTGNRKSFKSVQRLQLYAAAQSFLQVFRARDSNDKRNRYVYS